MKDSSTRSPARRTDGFHRYLKPGALARIRNSKINARSTTTSLLKQSLSPPQDPSSSSQISVAETTTATAAHNLTVDQVPYLLRKVYGPSSFNRKKLAAARSVSSMMVMTSIIESNGGNIGSDVIAH